jgi:alginate O-acetyltransferase complex protein AlgI
MVFSSIVFLLGFLPVFLITYYLVPARFKNLTILLFSIVFYSWGAPRFIFVILGTTFVDFHLVKWMASMESRLKRRLLLSLSVSINLGLLVYFKYSNFFIQNFDELLGAFGIAPVTWTKLVLPIGISFYTFETITYVVDVYRRVHAPLHNFWDYQLYIILYPKLIAGPIIRYHQLADQITDRSANETMENRLTGFYRFAIGLAKKVLIANQMGQQADLILASDLSTMGSGTAWIGILAYTFQIYFDFSGYSDMAIGLGRMMGFKFPENFDNPYLSRSITEFWRRWHITLGAWMRNYLYIPLGGNRVKTRKRLYFNLWIVFLASGLWHGAAWTFVFWGAYHGLWLVMERGFLLKIYEKIGRLPSTAITFLLVVIGWVFFRIEDFPKAFAFLGKLFAFDKGQTLATQPGFLFWFFFAVLFSFFAWPKWGRKIQEAIFFDPYSERRHYLAAPAAVILVLLSVSAITSTGFNPFIYFRF